MINNYFMQIAARNVIGENTKFIKPYIQKRVGVNEFHPEDPFDIINKQDRMNVSSNTEIIQRVTADKESNQKNSDSFIHPGSFANSNSKEDLSSLDMPDDNAELTPDKDINSMTAQINSNSTTKGFIPANVTQDSFLNLKDYKSDPDINIEKRIFEYGSESFKDIKDNIHERTELSKDTDSKNKMFQQHEIIEPLKVFKESSNQKHITKEAGTNEKTFKPANQNVKEMIPRKTPNQIEIIEIKQKPELIVGNLTVEVIQSPKEKKFIKELPEKNNSAALESHPDQTIRSSSLKIQYGMGQI